MFDQPIAKDHSTAKSASLRRSSIVRTETALSRFPMHCLTKGSVQIERQNDLKVTEWKVTHNSQYGQPGALAYKIETLFINRRIYEQGPAKKFIRLGSMRDIAQEVGLGTNTNAVKVALLQNATSTIAAKIWYFTKNHQERWLEAVFNRYSVVFSGESLPNGHIADCVYLILNDIYQELLTTVQARPLDLGYMKSLPPLAQRFYEIVSYQIFAAVKHGNPRAKLAYSEFCSLSTATRYDDFARVKKQMYKVLKPHKQSGYISDIQYESICSEGKAGPEYDWTMCLTPGNRARDEYRAFNREPRHKIKSPANLQKENGVVNSQASAPLTNSVLPNYGGFENPAEILPITEHQTAAENNPQGKRPKPRQRGHREESIPKKALQSPDAITLNDDDQALIRDLVAAELDQHVAEQCVRERKEICQRQLAYLPYVPEFTTSQGAYLRRAIENDYSPPAGYRQVQQTERKLQEEQAQLVKNTLANDEEKARQSHEQNMQSHYFSYLCDWIEEWSLKQPEEAEVFLALEHDQLQLLKQGPFANRPLNRRGIEEFNHDQSRAERLLKFFREEGCRFELRPFFFWQWDQNHNPQPFSFSKDSEAE